MEIQKKIRMRYFLDRLDGLYKVLREIITAEDVGTSVKDMEWVRTETR
ncbi:hypothetical protein Ct9H90mP29_03710 [bacterium]|nr:MAG: hypothetical protein Ct9H90mP29_03710 [bacterium]